MKSMLLAGLTVGAALLATSATARPNNNHDHAKSAYAYCAGGPNGPAYAFSNPRTAETCSRKIAAYSQDCRRFVRTGGCVVYNYWSINAVNPGLCQCAPTNTGYVGYWY